MKAVGIRWGYTSLKFLLLIIIAYGFALEPLVGFSSSYNCEPETPVHFGAPFVSKKFSLGSSMTFHYSILGLLMNTLFWLLIFLILRHISKLLIKREHFRQLKRMAMGSGFLLASFAIYGQCITCEPSFGPEANYWWWKTPCEQVNTTLLILGTPL
ncbi:conserved membrane hypothetical protein [Tenacibaculum litopenaei]|uniref:hypothetical protein n=1 Tax=Tenacibaculum litopenaei TaxID=396016 RepID=UPI0038958033